MQNNNVEAIYPLSPLQQGILFLNSYTSNAGVYITQFSIQLRGNLQNAALKEAWEKVTERHAILRTLFLWEEREKPLQVVYDRVTIPWNEYDWRNVDSTEQQKRLKDFLQSDLCTDFVTSQAPLMRFHLIQLSDTIFQLICSFHHAILDGWSTSLVFREVITFYRTICAGQKLVLDEPRPYKEYIRWLQRQDLTQAEAYWRQHLKGFRTTTPFMVDRKLASTAAKTDYVRNCQQIKFPQTTTRALQAFVKEHKFTLNVLIQGAWALLLSRYSGESDVVFGTTVAGRSGAFSDMEAMVGLFINTLPMRIQVPPTQSLLSWLQGIFEQQLRLYDFDYSPLVQIQGWSDITPGTPLFESVVLFDNYQFDESMMNWGEDLKACQLETSDLTHYPLALSIIPDEELIIDATYQSTRFDADTIERLLGHLKTLLVSMILQPKQQLQSIFLLTERERVQQLIEWNATTSTAFDPTAESFLHLFEQQVQRTPGAIAVSYEKERLTYSDLNHRANKLAHHLWALDRQPEEIIAVLDWRGVNLLVAILAIFKVGGTYLPLDPLYPEARIQQVLDCSKCRIILAGDTLPENLQSFLHNTEQTPTRQVLSLETLLQEDAPLVAAMTDYRPHPHHLAYIIYTSGSTGIPKGAMLQYSGMLNHLYSKISTFHLTQNDCIAQIASQCFDISIWQFLAILLVGGEVRVIPNHVVQNPAELLTQLERYAVTILEVVPAILQAMLEEIDHINLTTLRCLISNAEAIRPHLCTRWFAAYPQTELWNVYGPTECSDDVSSYQITSDSITLHDTIPIGYPICNTQLYVLDTQLQPVPIGVAGELYVGGTGVGRGYFQDPLRTAEIFLPNPFTNIPGQRLYKTGDRVKYLPDGNIEFLGRIDYQVKIRGLRIELGEIEHILSTQPMVQEAVVTVTDDAVLIAYVVPQQAHVLSVPTLQSALRERLPAYMVPSLFIMMDTFPLTPNGKIDRSVLPMPDRLLLQRDFVAPRTPTELELEHIWKAILKREHISVHDSFFELGGHSLSATQVISRIRTSFGIDFPIRRFFESPTIAQLAGIVENNTRDKVPATISPVARLSREAYTMKKTSLSQT